MGRNKVSLRLKLNQREVYTGIPHDDANTFKILRIK